MRGRSNQRYAMGTTYLGDEQRYLVLQHRYELILINADQNASQIVPAYKSKAGRNPSVSYKKILYQDMPYIYADCGYP